MITPPTLKSAKAADSQEHKRVDISAGENVENHP